MSNRRWIQTCLLSILLLVALNEIALAALDPYGLFRNSTGRRLSLYYSDRLGKFLLNTHYVPQNFDALLVGPSSSVNWDTQVIAKSTGLHFYNESLEGGTGTEERLLVDRALAHGHFRAAMIVVYPTMTSTHKMEEGLDKAHWTQGLGSMDEYIQLAVAAMVRLHIPVNDHGALPDGSHAMHNPRGIDENAKIDFHQDPEGVHNLQLLTSELQANGARVICIQPAVFQSVAVSNAVSFAKYKSEMMAALPGTTWIDLNAPEYAALRSDPNNYIDAFHVTPEGALKISHTLNLRVLPLLGH